MTGDDKRSREKQMENNEDNKEGGTGPEKN